MCPNGALCWAAFAQKVRPALPLKFRNGAAECSSLRSGRVALERVVRIEGRRLWSNSPAQGRSAERLHQQRLLPQS